MYKLFYGGHVLHDPTTEVCVREPEIDLLAGEPGHISFVLDEDHPAAELLQKLKGTVRLEEDGNAIWRGRVISDDRDFQNSRQVTVEGLLGCLRDSVVPPFDFPADWEENPDYQAAAQSGNVVQFFLNWLVSNHNAQVGEARKIMLGQVTVADPNNYITRSSAGYSTTLDVINDKLVKLLGGYLLPDYTNEVMKLEYYDQLPLTNTQTVEYAGNLLDLQITVDAADTYTAIWPTGADGLTIQALPDQEIGSDLVKQGQIIYSKSAERDIGSRIIRHVEWQDVTVPENLRQKAAAQLTSSGIRHIQTITVQAADLGGQDGKKPFRVGRMVRIISTPHGLELTLPLTELQINLDNPADTIITLGQRIQTASDINEQHRHDTDAQLEDQQIEMNKKEEEILSTTTTRTTEAVQNSERILLEAMEKYVETGEYEEYKKTLQTQLEVMADGVDVKITETQERVEDVNGDMQSRYESITKLIRATIDGILIGESGSELQLRLDNDIIEMLVAGLAEMYINKSGMVANQATVRELNMGDYAFRVGSDGHFTLS